jgi:putative hydrolase of the HAD superfamily
MKEVFGKKKITSREFPVILFDAAGTLFHPTPSYEKIYKAVLAECRIEKSDQEVDQLFISILRKFNERAESEPSFELLPKLWTEAFIEELGASADSQRLSEKLNTAINQTKMGIAQSTEDICLQLRDRGYQLGIVSNWNGILSDFIRDQDLLPYFETIITSIDVGASKPRKEIFDAALRDLDLEASKTVFVGASYAADMVGAEKAGLHRILYDPKFRELRALSLEDTSGKVVSIESIKHNRRLSDIRVIVRFEELLEIFS